MNRRRVLILLLVVAAIAWVLHGRLNRGPLYQGRYTADWVAEALRGHGRSPAFEAVLKIGSPAVPFLARQGLHDKCHTFRSLAADRVLVFAMAHPRLNRWLGLMNRLDNCTSRHAQASWMLFCLGTNAQAAIPDLTDCLEHCPSLRVSPARDLFDTLEEISGTNPAAIPYLTRRARRDDSLSLLAATVAYSIDGRTNLLLETCNRLAGTDPARLSDQGDLDRLRQDPRFKAQLAPLLKKPQGERNETKDSAHEN